MDTRKALNKGVTLQFYNHCNGLTVYTINKEIARGGSCIVYDASYINNAGSSKTVIIKECYPFKLNISRDKSGLLTASDSQYDEFNRFKDKMKNAFDICNDLFGTDNLTNSISNTIDIYEANNTVYIVSTYSQGQNLANRKITTLKECISIIESTAKAIKKIHDKGYLYLDIKPENVFCLYDTDEIVQLFDFDSLIPVPSLESGQSSHIKISYTKGFSALELQMGNLKKIGKHTDVYGIGALLFYLIFGHTPSALDCEPDAEYNFTSSSFLKENYSEKAFDLLTQFFHKTLANYCLDRYQDMEQVVEKLEEIKAYSFLDIPFIYSTKISKPVFFVGRTDEIQILDNWFMQDKRNCFIVYGMGGIGKSTLIHEYLSARKSDFDIVLYVNYKSSVLQTVTDDEQININNIKKDADESISEYFNRKLNIIQKLIINKNAVIVIDNYSGEICSEFNKLLSLNWKVVLITRSKSSVQNYDSLNLNAIQNRRQLYALFSNYLQKEIKDNEYTYIDNIINKVFGHTLILELIAKQISNSYLSIAEVSDIIDQYGFSDIAPEKVNYTKDSSVYHETIHNIINILFESANLTAIQKVILNTLSLFGTSKTSIRIFADMLELDTKDDINKLISEGWITLENTKISMHPVIIETVRQWKWTDDFKSAALKAMIFITNKITPADITQHSQNYKQTNLYIHYSEKMLESCKNQKSLVRSKIYQELLYTTIINMPRDRENYILAKSDELLNNTNSLSNKEIIDLYDKVISIYEDKRCFDTADVLIDQANKFANHSKDNTTMGLYYDILAGLYDTKLNGFYDTQTCTDKINLKNLIRSLNKAIHFLKKSKENDGIYTLTECVISKAIVLIRSNPEQKRKIHSLLTFAYKIINSNFQHNSRLLFSFNMAYAWYYTIAEPNEKLTYEYVDNASDASENIYYSDLDYIDSIIIPKANIDLEWQRYESSAQQIISGISLCEKHNDVLPYIRKKAELYNCLLDIYDISENIEKYQDLLNIIENDNSKKLLTE